jgi:acyl-CoA-binding protein
MQAPCRLPYPERYDKALEFYNNWPERSKQPSQDTQLILFGLSCQVAQGPCKEPQPSSWKKLESAKWAAWHGLKDMDRNEAMRLFVRTLEEEEVSCFGLLPHIQNNFGSCGNDHDFYSEVLMRKHVPDAESVGTTSSGS